MADSFIRLTLRDDSTHTVVSEADPAALVDAAARPALGRRKRLDRSRGRRRRDAPARAARQVVTIELFER
jgi:hypothetical protein